MPVPDLSPELYTHFIFFLPHISTLLSDRDLKLSMPNSKLLISLPPRSALPPGSLINAVYQTKNLRCTLDSVLEGSKFYLPPRSFNATSETEFFVPKQVVETNTVLKG